MTRHAPFSLRRLLGVPLLALLVALSVSAPAWAGSDQFMTNMGLSAGNAYGSGGAHIIGTIQIYTDHTACPSMEQGFGGYTSTPFSYPFYYSNCGYPIPSWSPGYVPGGAYHGAVLNPNGATFDNIASAVYTW
jgi:hypothetical protein